MTPVLCIQDDIFAERTASDARSSINTHGIANFALVLICVAFAWNYEKDGQTLRSTIQNS